MVTALSDEIYKLVLRLMRNPLNHRHIVDVYVSYNYTRSQLLFCIDLYTLAHAHTHKEYISSFGVNSKSQSSSKK